jgi:hypothetical protein
VSLIAAVRVFANQRYLVAPEPGVTAMLANAPEDWIRWRLMGNMLESIETNRTKLSAEGAMAHREPNRAHCVHRTPGRILRVEPLAGGA